MSTLATTEPDRRRADWPLIIGLGVSLVAHLALGLVVAHREHLFPRGGEPATLAAVQPIRPPQERVPLGGDRPKVVTVSWIGAEELIESASPDPSEVDQARQERDPAEEQGLTAAAAPLGSPTPPQPMLAERVIEGEQPRPGAEPTPPSPDPSDAEPQEPVTPEQALAIAASTPSPASEASDAQPETPEDPREPTDTPTTETTDQVADADQPRDESAEEPGEQPDPTEIVASLTDAGDLAAERRADAPPTSGVQSPQSAASPESSPQTPTNETSAPVQPAATPPAAAPPPGSPQTEPTPTPAQPSDRETPFAARKRAPRVVPGQQVESQGLRIQTTAVHHSSTTYATGRHRGRQLVVRIHFGANGRPRHVDILRSSGDAFIDQDYRITIHREWRARGPAIDELPSSSPNASIPVELRIIR
ncbi:MAG: hypothetical protein AAGI30_10780 [Planctomycetota bacterium]